MPIKCYNKPNRTKARRYTPSDLTRIAGYVHEDGIPWYEIVGYALAATGSAWLICRLSSAVTNVLGMMAMVKKLSFFVGLSLSLRALITMLIGSPLVRFPFIRRGVVVTIIILLLIDRALAMFLGLVNDILFLDDILGKINQSCEIAERVIDKAVEKGKETVEQVNDSRQMEIVRNTADNFQAEIKDRINELIEEDVGEWVNEDMDTLEEYVRYYRGETDDKP